jgi:predicted transcriptional regulator
MSEIGDGNGHTTQSLVEFPQVPSYLPLVTIGKAGGALKTGQIVRFDVDRPAGDLYLTLARAMGANNASFPDATAPLTELLT